MFFICDLEDNIWLIANGKESSQYESLLSRIFLTIKTSGKIVYTVINRFMYNSFCSKISQ